MLAAAMWWQKFRARSNDTFLPLLWDQSRYLVLMGGGGSGKSIFAGDKVLERVTSEEGHRYLVCRKVQKTLRESCFKQLVDRAREYYPDDLEKVNQTDMRMQFRNGSEILFAGLDDVEKLKSIYNITGIWIEEASELLESDFNQLDIRLRGVTRYYKQIIITFNPISISHWLKKRFFDRQDPRARTHHSTYKDNRFLDEESIRTLEGYRETDPYYYQVYCLGQWGVTGKTVFDAQALSRRLEQLKDYRPVHRGEFLYEYDGLRITNIRWAEAADGMIEIFTEPAAGVPYVVGGDTAGEGSDWFIGQVIDNTTGRQVAKLRHQMDEDVYARQIYCLGMHYNQALLAIEANFSTFPNKELQRLRYPNLFVREVEDTYTGQIRTAYGFKTTSLTRPVIIAGLIQAVRDDPTIVTDRVTIEEMLTFVRNPQTLRPEAAPGSHDDCVIALAITHYARSQQSMTAEQEPRLRTEWTRDMWEDFRRADAETQAYLIAKWGNPVR